MKNGILPPELKNISQLFTSNNQYVVPKYQRSYAWTLDETEEFWDDLLDAAVKKTEYFLGTIVLQIKENAVIEIIDGQQRLTSISMVFSAIRQRFLAANDDRASRIYNEFLGSKGFSRHATATQRLTLNDINNETYAKYILEGKSINDVLSVIKAERKKLDESNLLLLSSYRFLLEKVSTEAAKHGANADEDFLVPLLDTIKDSLKLITISVSSEENANLFFESLNARGKELAISDLFKNRLFAEAGSQVKKAQSSWAKMESELGRRSRTDFLRHYWIAKKASGVVRERDLYRLLLKEIKGKAQSAIDLAADLAVSAADYAKITDFDLWESDPAYDKSFEATLEELKLFRVSQCNPILLNGIQCFKKPKEVTGLFRYVANFSFRYFIIGNQSPGNLEHVSNRIAEGIRTNAYKTANDVARELLTVSSDSAFKSDFELAEFPKAKAKLARYTLKKIEDYLVEKKSPETAERVVDADPKKVNLEHILPQSITPAWKSGFSANIDPADYVYRIGNLTLLTLKLNEKIGNTNFAAKMAHFAKSELTINDALKKTKKWGDKEIEARQGELAKAALGAWKL
jgi:hypothetical protein